MTTVATHITSEHTSKATLFVAFELSEKTWKLGFTTGHGQKPRERTMAARQQERVLDEIAQAARGQLHLQFRRRPGRGQWEGHRLLPPVRGHAPFARGDQ